MSSREEAAMEGECMRTLSNRLEIELQSAKRELKEAGKRMRLAIEEFHIIEATATGLAGKLRALKDDPEAGEDARLSEILELKGEGMPVRKIAADLGMSKSAVQRALANNAGGKS